MTSDRRTSPARPASPRQRQPKQLTTLAASVVVLAGLVGCGDDGGDPVEPGVTTTEPAPGTRSPNITAPPGSGSAPPGSPGTTSSTRSSADEDGTAAAEAVAAFIDAIAAGELQAAWALVDERSRSALGGFDDFERLGSALSEGFGAWAQAEERDIAAMRVTAAGSTTWVVAVWGRVALEGPVDLHATSMPVYVRDGEAMVSPFEDVSAAGALVSFDPPPGSTIAPDQVPVVDVPEALTAVAFVGDDQAIPTPTSRAPGSQALELVPSEPLGPGAHAFTVVVLRDADVVATASAAYRVER